MVERSQKEVWRLTPWLMIALLLGNVILMAFDARDVTTGQRIIRSWVAAGADFVQSPVSSATNAATNYFTSISNLRAAASDNDTLKQRIQELEVELKQHDDLVTENERLRSMLKLTDESKYKVVTARIIGRDPSAWFDSSTINRGSIEGIKINMPVVADGGLIGRVTAVSPLSAQIDLITRDKSGLGAIVGQINGSNAIGILTGTSKRDLMELKYVPGTVEVQVGQQVFTTGQDQIFPGGLIVGEIVSVEQGSATTPSKILVRPSAKLSSMQEVGVLLYEPPARADFDKSVTTAPTPKK